MTTEQNGRNEAAAPQNGDEKPGPSWFAALRTRLGLQDPQTLRDTLEDALRGDADAASSAFSNEEREMLLRMLKRVYNAFSRVLLFPQHCCELLGLGQLEMDAA